jgi:hypothetical protein
MFDVCHALAARKMDFAGMSYFVSDAMKLCLRSQRLRRIPLRRRQQIE